MILLSSNSNLNCNCNWIHDKNDTSSIQLSFYDFNFLIFINVSLEKEINSYSIPIVIFFLYNKSQFDCNYIYIYRPGQIYFNYLLFLISYILFWSWVLENKHRYLIFAKVNYTFQNLIVFISKYLREFI